MEKLIAGIIEKLKTNRLLANIVFWVINQDLVAFFTYLRCLKNHLPCLHIDVFLFPNLAILEILLCKKT